VEGWVWVVHVGPPFFNGIWMLCDAWSERRLACFLCVAAEFMGVVLIRGPALLGVL
jgi:hypothetical protein